MRCGNVWWAVKPTILFLALALAAIAQEAPKVFFADDFNRAELGGAWRVSTPAFVIENQQLKAGQIGPGHSAVGFVKVGAANVVLEVRFRLGTAKTINCVFNDKNYTEGHGGHICRVSITPRALFLADDKERFRGELDAMYKDPGKKAEVAKRTAGMSKNVAVKINADAWHTLRIEIHGETLKAVLDDQTNAELTSKGIAHANKEEFYFAVAGSHAIFDDLRITEAR